MCTAPFLYRNEYAVPSPIPAAVMRYCDMRLHTRACEYSPNRRKTRKEKETVLLLYVKEMREARNRTIR